MPILKTDHREIRFRCAKCGDEVLAENDRAGRRYVEGWQDGHLPKCDPPQFIEVRFGVPRPTEVPDGA